MPRHALRTHAGLSVSTQAPSLTLNRRKVSAVTASASGSDRIGCESRLTGCGGARGARFSYAKAVEVRDLQERRDSVCRIRAIPSDADEM
jgi:hypothetical protein